MGDRAGRGMCHDAPGSASPNAGYSGPQTPVYAEANRSCQQVMLSTVARSAGARARGTAGAMVPTEDAQTTIVESVGSGQARYQGFRAVGHFSTGTSASAAGRVRRVRREGSAKCALCAEASIVCRGHECTEYSPSANGPMAQIQNRRSKFHVRRPSGSTLPNLNNAARAALVRNASGSQKRSGQQAKRFNECISLPPARIRHLSSCSHALLSRRRVCTRGGRVRPARFAASCGSCLPPGVPSSPLS